MAAGYPPSPERSANYRVKRWPGRLRHALGVAVKEPLCQFLFAGALVFATQALLNPGSDKGRLDEIRVDRSTLLSFVQSRMRYVDPHQAESHLETLDAADLDKLVQEIARDEALYREALALGLDKQDIAIRQRLIQSVKFVYRDAKAANALDDASLRSYYASHRDDYRMSPAVTFTHVFFSGEAHGWKRAGKLAQEALAQLNGAGQEDTLPGDRFIYQLNYVAQNEDLIASHFGSALAATLFSLPIRPQTWQGPYRSIHGYHLLKIQARDDGKLPSFEQVRERVAHDAREAAIGSAEERMQAALLARYRIDVSRDIRQRIKGRD